MNNTAQNEKTLLTVPEVARRLRISRTTVHKLISDGELRVIQVGSRRCLRVDSAALDEWLAAHTTGAARTEGSHANA